MSLANRWPPRVRFLALSVDLAFRLGPELLDRRKFAPALEIVSPIDLAALPTATRFDFPLGSEHGAMAYNAQPFTENSHLGDDLNGIGGENSDLGDPVFAVADGQVFAAREGGPGWGNVIIVLHAYRENGARKYVQSFYGHLQTILVAPREKVRRGQQIATVGTGGGNIWRICISKCASSSRLSSEPAIARTRAAGSIRAAFIQAHRGAPDERCWAETGAIGRIGPTGPI